VVNQLFAAVVDDVVERHGVLPIAWGSRRNRVFQLFPDLANSDSSGLCGYQGSLFQILTVVGEDLQAHGSLLLYREVTRACRSCEMEVEAIRLFRRTEWRKGLSRFVGRSRQWSFAVPQHKTLDVKSTLTLTLGR
jgi:hypothetical protein